MKELHLAEAQPRFLELRRSRVYDVKVIRSGVWLLAVFVVCGLGWRDGSRAAVYVWQHPETATCAGIPRFESLAATLPANGDVMFVGAEPAPTLDGEYFEFYRRFICVQYVLAPAVVHFVFTPSLLTHHLAGTVDVLVVDIRHNRAETLRNLEALAARRGTSVHEDLVAPDLLVATIANR